MKTKNMKGVARRIFFYGAFVLACAAVGEKIANTFKYTLFAGMPEPSRLFEYAVVALLFAIAIQLDQIRILLNSKASEP
jgi:hypothetical protein